MSMDDLGLNTVHAVCARRQVVEINECIEPQHPGQTETVCLVWTLKTDKAAF